MLPDEGVGQKHGCRNDDGPHIARLAASPAALTLVGIMAGAALTHLVHGEAPRAIVNAVLSTALITVFTLSSRPTT